MYKRVCQLSVYVCVCVCVRVCAKRVSFCGRNEEAPKSQKQNNCETAQDSGKKSCCNMIVGCCLSAVAVAVAIAVAVVWVD